MCALRRVMRAWPIGVPAGLALREPLLSVPDDEPNDTVAQAVVTGLVNVGAAIGAGAEIGNRPLAAADRGFFSFEVTEFARLPLLPAGLMTADEPGYDGYVRLFGYFPRFDDPYQPCELANHDDIDATHLDPLLQPYIVEPGTYTVSASHSQNPAFSPTDGSSGRPSAVGGFDLAIILLEALTPDGAYETEDVPCISADPILESTPSELAGPGSASFTASIGDGLFGAFRGDVDFYQLPPVLDERLEIDVSPTGDPASLIPVVHLYDDIATHLASWTADQTGVVHGTFERRCRGFTGPLDPDSPVEYAAVMGAKDRPPMDPFAGVSNLPDGTSPRPDPAPLSAIDGSPGGGRSKPATADTAIGRCLTTVWA